MPPWVGFFAFHGLLSDPGPVPAIVHRDGKVVDCSRSARALGVEAGQSAAAARTHCPDAAFSAYDPAGAAARLLRAWDLLADVAARVEPDPDGRPQACAAWSEGAPPKPEVASLAAAVRDGLPHVDLAAGLAESQLLARAACPVRGVGWVEDARACQRLLAALPLADLTAQSLITPPLLRRLHDMGLFACGQVADVPASALLARFGRDGPRLYDLCRGRDPRPVRALHPPRTLSARRAFADGLPPARWAAAAASLARRASAQLQPGEGVRSLHLRAGRSERTRTWKSPRSGADLLGRAAAALAADLARGSRAPVDNLQVILADLVALPLRPLDLLAAERPDGQVLEGLLERLPRKALRRGWGRPDRHEALLALLDPWRSAP